MMKETSNHQSFNHFGMVEVTRRSCTDSHYPCLVPCNPGQSATRFASSNPQAEKEDENETINYSSIEFQRMILFL